MKHIKILHGLYDCTVSPTLPRYDFTATRGNNFKLVKHYCRYDVRKYFLLRELLNCRTVCHHMLTSINVGVVKNVYYNYKCDIAGTGNRTNSNK